MIDTITLIKEIGVAFICIISMIIFHEIGHWIALKKFGYPYKFTFNKSDIGFDYKIPLEDQKDGGELLLFMGGIFLGFVPLVLYGSFFNYKLTGHIIFIVYLIGCWWDIKEIDKIITTEIKAIKNNKKKVK